MTAHAGVVGDICMYDQSAGQAQVADFDDTTWLDQANNDQIDDDKITQVPALSATWAATDGDSIIGILLGDVAASATNVPIACFGSMCVFEANLTSQVDGDTPATALTSLVSHRGRNMYIASIDSGLTTFTGLDDNGATVANTTQNGLWVLSDTAGTGGTGNIARIIDIGYGFSGEDPISGHGVIGDKNVRVRFTVAPAATFLGM
jgi:hypothetical protein